MIFLIEYNRQKGRIVKLDRFKDSDRLKAEQKRLKLELDLNRKKIEHEVVLLEAEKESVLRQTHRRYFETLRGIANSTVPQNS